MTNIILFDDYSRKALNLMSNVLWGLDVESLERSEIIQLLKLLRWNLIKSVDLRQETSVLRKTLIDISSWIHTSVRVLSYAEEHSQEIKPHALVHVYFARLYRHNVDFNFDLYCFTLPYAYGLTSKGISVINISDAFAYEEVWDESDFPPVTITVGTTQYKSLLTFLWNEVGMYADDSVYKLYDNYLYLVQHNYNDIVEVLNQIQRSKENFTKYVNSRHRKEFYPRKRKFFSGDVWELMKRHNLILNKLIKLSTAVRLVKSKKVEFKFDLPSLKEFTKADASITVSLDTQNNEPHKYGLGTETRVTVVPDGEIPF